MKKYLFILVCIGFSTAMNAQLTISEDKPKHFGAGFVIGSVGGYTAHHMFDGNPYWMWAGAVGSSLAAGVTKEAIDKADYGVWDNNDIVYTVIGGVASAVVLDLFLKKSKKRRKYRPCNCYAESYKPKGNMNLDYFDITLSESHDITSALQAERILQLP